VSNDYVFLGAMILLVAVFGAVSMAASRLLAPRRPTRAKLAPYECGIVPTRDLPERFPVQFYLVAGIFLLFDIEIVFLYPWAVRFKDLGTFGFFEMLLFTALLLVAFFYALGEGVFDWSARTLDGLGSRRLQEESRREPDLEAA
jgi:NADH-quinone oxidoreductase subunit A